MLKFSMRIATATALLVASLNGAAAGLLGTINLRSAVQHIKFETPTLAPMAYTQFCLRYADQCQAQPTFRGGPVRLTEERLEQLTEINRKVNRDIIGERNSLGLPGETWLIGPTRGDCNDYAVTKRHELLARGWPARVLLLSEVVVRGGEHHLVLVVRTKSGDLVLDNMTPQIRSWAQAPYRWVRIQMPSDARIWATVGGRGV